MTSGPSTLATISAAAYRLDAPRTIFFTLRLADPRGTVRFPNGFSVFFFLRAARLVFLRSSLLKLFVFAMSAEVSSFKIQTDVYC
jgi:hypothetical protein